MNNNNLKRFAQEARRKLITQVESRLGYVLDADSAALREQSEQMQQLLEELNRSSRQQLVEKVAYTWFNRLIALRFMDANDYQPLGHRIISPRDGYTTPEILDEAKRGNIHTDLKTDRQRVIDLLDNKIKSTNPLNEAYRMLLIAACNHLNSVFPFLFEKIDDYTELLMPDDLTSEFSVMKVFREGIPMEDCKNVEIIGWLYQFYISEKKDEVFASKEKVSKEDIPAATQLFTPRWIVEYMVQNTLGKLWLQNRPKSKLREFMPYFIESESLQAEEFLKITTPEDIRFLDPASGSGHIMVYAFELFTKIYEEEGYNISDIPKLIIEKNLFGFEIDERAAQLSGLALMMKAREYQRRVFRREITPNVMCFKDLPLTIREIRDGFADMEIPVPENLIQDLATMQQATNFGSLIIPKAKPEEIQQTLARLASPAIPATLFQSSATSHLQTALRQLQQLAVNYHCVVTNPPYMGDSNFNKILSEYVNRNFPASRLDLMTCFMEAGINYIKSRGYLAMINQHSWMFISSYNELRKKLLESISINDMLHLGTRAFPEIGGEVVQNTTFTIQKIKNENNITSYIRLVSFDTTEKKRLATIEILRNKNHHLHFKFIQKNFKLIPNHNICYWFSKNLIENFKLRKISDISISKAGIVTGNDADFLRLWYEISKKFINFKEIAFQHSPNLNWVPINKGGGIRKFYGNEEYIINIFNLWLNGRTGKSVRRGDPTFYYKEAITWTMVCGTSFSFRYAVFSTFATAAPALFFNSKNQTLYTLGFLNSKISTTILAGINPTINLGSGDVSRLPIIASKVENAISLSVIENINISKTDWNSRETSWDFKRNELIRLKSNDSMYFDEAIDLYQYYWTRKFLQLHENEESLNRQFIEIYELQDELTPDVPLEDITILQDELDRKALAQLNDKLERDPQTRAVMNYESIAPPFMAGLRTHESIAPPFMVGTIISQFISYAIGCMFGRYSLDKEGLILANQGETLKDYLNKIEKTEEECSFLPDADNIIPILDDEWFADDIVGRFKLFLRVTFGEANFQKNLKFIENQLGKDIRKYFIKDFYADHLQRYKKRPIYWMFSSPKGSFNALIYMHRYNKDTLNMILNRYLREFIGKLQTRREHLKHVEVTGTPTDKAVAIKEADKIAKMLTELIEYERDMVFPIAIDRIIIDLDDGVLVNYNRFGKAIKEVSGLNDAATHKKVEMFDWVKKDRFEDLEI